MPPSALFTLPALRRARDMIDLRYPEPLDLAALAREAGYSRFHFARAFAAAHGETPRAYLTRRRLERASGNWFSLTQSKWDAAQAYAAPSAPRGAGPQERPAAASPSG
jgi:methylphosphotriester-DNA--protein-cysteine methyltransferase